MGPYKQTIKVIHFTFRSVHAIVNFNIIYKLHRDPSYLWELGHVQMADIQMNWSHKHFWIMLRKCYKGEVYTRHFWGLVQGHQFLLLSLLLMLLFLVIFFTYKNLKRYSICIIFSSFQLLFTIILHIYCLFRIICSWKWYPFPYSFPELSTNFTVTYM